MPNFIRPSRLGRHTLSSAIACLRALGITDDRIVVESAGGGWTTGTVVKQEPSPGEPIPHAAHVVLDVAGFGALQALPYAMRDEDPDGFGADRLMALFDHESYRVLSHLRDAAGLFNISESDPIAARRFCEDLFLISVKDIRPQLWFRLSRVVPLLASLAGRTEGLRVAIAFVTGVPVAAVRVQPTRLRETGPVAGTRLGVQELRLGVDAWVGPAVDQDRVDVVIEFGPVAIDTYFDHIGDDRRRERDALYALLLPSWASGMPDERWRVGSASAGSRLGGDAVVALGVNSYLTTGEQRSADG